MRAAVCYELGSLTKLVSPAGKLFAQKKFQATYTAERKFEVREFAFNNPAYSYQQVADAFNRPKTTVFDIIKRDPCGQPAKGRGNKKGAGRQLSYSQETAAGPVDAGNEGSTLASFSSADEGEGTAADPASDSFI